MRAAAWVVVAINGAFSLGHYFAQNPWRSAFNFCSAIVLIVALSL